MEFTDEGIILSARANGENHAVAEVLTAAHGKWAGLVYGGQGKKMRPVLQPGNRARCVWKGRVADSLGHFSLELDEPVAAATLHNRLALTGLSAACVVAQAVLPERQPDVGVYNALGVVLDHLDDIDLWPALLARWELGVLSAVGFGLTLDKCAATGTSEDLAYVSPKSAQAVSAEAGAPYEDRMLRLPSFLTAVNATETIELADAIDALTLTGYFLETRVLHAANQPLPEARRRLVELLTAETDAD
ncbi:MAG: DNA repair protein RecO [Pseudomonadota bacterium]